MHVLIWTVVDFHLNSQLFLLGGELHFLQIGGTCDDVDEADILVDASLSKVTEQLTEGTKPLSNPSSPGITGKSSILHSYYQKVYY